MFLPHSSAVTSAQSFTHGKTLQCLRQFDASDTPLSVCSRQTFVFATFPVPFCDLETIIRLLFFPCFLRSRKDSLESESSAAIVPHELVRTRQLESVHLKFNQESGTLLPLCLRYCRRSAQFAKIIPLFSPSPKERRQSS